MSRGLTVVEVAGRYRVSHHKVHAWIRTGEMQAVNTALSGKPRWVVTPEAIEAFEQRRQGKTPTKTKTPRRPRSTVKDYFPAI